MSFIKTNPNPVAKKTCSKVPHSHGCKGQINVGNCTCNIHATGSVVIMTMPHNPKQELSVRPPKGCVSEHLPKEIIS
jgi:hypothetical protein